MSESILLYPNLHPNAKIEIHHTYNKHSKCYNKYIHGHHTRGKKLGPQSEEHRRNSSITHIGKVPWNKGLTKETDCRIAKSIPKISKARQRFFENGGQVAWKGKALSSKRKKELEDLEKTMYARKNSDSKKGVLISKVL